MFLGGVITEYASWPWVFHINLPIAVLAVAAAPALLPGGAGTRGSIDWIGAATATFGLGGLVFAIVRAPEVGWASAQTWGVLIGAAALLAVFFTVQAKRREPLMPLAIFRSANLGAANLAQALLGAAWIPMWFFLNLYLQQVLGYSAFPSGAALLPMTALIMIGMVVLAPRLTAKFGPKAMIVTGLVLLAAGLGWLSLVRPDGTFAADVLPASLVAALGMSLAFIPSLQMAISSAAPEQGGLASGIVNTSYQIGSALGLAAVTAIAVPLGADELGDPVALTDGYSAAFIAAAAVAVLAIIATAATVRSRRPDLVKAA
nr:MFS transporter [Glycomyces sp. YM15]